jgi:hypothetical protein
MYICLLTHLLNRVEWFATEIKLHLDHAALEGNVQNMNHSGFMCNTLPSNATPRPVLT